ncbi:hypothetical protein [Arthrobacter sp. 2MCAF14]|uniref:hypothetical protein n=1 Tax=Arthrobacter sp. 2MCAF14 TaxID=3232982 RepID=UPI003F921129
METTSPTLASRSSEEPTGGVHRVVFSDPEEVKTTAVRDLDAAPVPAVFSSHY